MLPHRLEFLTAVTSAVLVIVVYVPNSYDDSRWIRWTLMLRLLRFCRFLRLARMPPMLRMLSNILSVRHVRIFYRTFIMAVPNAMRLIKVRLALCTRVSLACSASTVVNVKALSRHV